MKSVLFLCLFTSIAISVFYPCCIDILRAQEIEIINNPEKGEWQDDDGLKIEFLPELEIGSDDGDGHDVFGRIGDVAVDGKGQIYVLDTGFARVQVFDSLGTYLRTIGRKGSGPGEFHYPTALAVRNDGVLYVGADNRVSRFGPDGEFLDFFDMHFKDGSAIFALALDTSGSCFVLKPDIVEQLLIHKYDEEGEHIISFCDSYASGKDVSVLLEGFYSGGYLDIGPDDTIYFTQYVPYEIREYTCDGLLVKRIYRKNSFMPPPPDSRVTGGDIEFVSPVSSSSIVTFGKGRLLNVVWLPPVDRPEIEIIVDLFDEEGALLASRRFQDNFDIECSDSRGRFYFVHKEEYPRVVRYRLSTG